MFGTLSIRIMAKQIQDRTHRIHGTGIFTYICHKHQLNLGKYTTPMDPMANGAYLPLGSLNKAGHETLLKPDGCMLEVVF